MQTGYPIIMVGYPVQNRKDINNNLPEQATVLY